MIRFYSLIILLTGCFSCVYAHVSSEIFLFYFPNTPLSSAVNVAGLPDPSGKIKGQILYENRYLLKAFAVKSIAVGGVVGFKSWNAAYQQQGTFHYQSHDFRLNYSSRLHSNCRIGVNLYVQAVKQSTTKQLKWLAYPEIGVNYNLDQGNKIFSSLEYIPSKSVSHYAAAVFYERKLERKMVVIVGVRSMTHQQFLGSIAFCIKPQVGHAFTLELNNGQHPIYFNYRFSVKSLCFHVGFWYHNQLPISNQLSISYVLGEDKRLLSKNSTQYNAL